uniref:Saccharopine dehydrogenase isoform 2 n=2 Tax=Tetraselmis sp. GSL018 TaxID=582737 RepID=A0A061RI91_9CHLO
MASCRNFGMRFHSASTRKNFTHVSESTFGRTYCTTLARNYPNACERRAVYQPRLMLRSVSYPARKTSIPKVLALSNKVTSSEDSITRIIIVGGTGAVGSAVAAHLLSEATCRIEVVLVGRDKEKGARRVAELSARLQTNHQICFEPLDWRKKDRLRDVIRGASVVIHTAGPYLGQQPDILQECIRGQIPCYVDLADPLDYIQAAVALSPQAEKANTMAILAGGAFPGFSNVIAMECAARLNAPIRDVSFRYFTAGLGGSGPINLLITNQGFGEPVPRFRRGSMQPAMVSGLEPERVRFYLDSSDASAARVGERTVWSWPFPEVATVAKELRITSDSSVKMGTSPEAWNVIMGWLVKAVPREWWRNEAFSKWMADFSEPMVTFTDQFVGETHCMRIDVTDTSGNTCTAIQGHDSFRRVVGQSCAEFALELLQRSTEEEGGARWTPGVYLPEQLFADSQGRARVLQRLSSVPGTFTYRYSMEPSGGYAEARTKETGAEELKR